MHAYPAGSGLVIRFGPLVPGLFAGFLIAIVYETLWVLLLIVVLGLGAILPAVLKARDYANTVEVSEVGLRLKTFWKRTVFLGWDEVGKVIGFTAYDRRRHLLVVSVDGTRRAVLSDRLSAFDSLVAALGQRATRAHWEEAGGLWLRIRYGE